MLSKTILIGRVGKDPVVKQFSNNGSVAEFSLATDDSYTKNGEKVQQTDWHNIKSTFPKLNEVIEKYVKKGMLVYVEGKLKYRSYDDKDGNKKYVTEIVADSVKFLSKSEDGAAAQTSAGSNVGGEDDSLPF